MTIILRNLLRDRGGAGASEYVLLLGLIGIAIIAGGRSVGTSVNDQLSAASIRLSNGS